MNSTRSALTNTERRILAVLFRREADLMLPPTIRELAESLASSQNTVMSGLYGLRDRGMVTWVEGCARTLRLTCRLVPLGLAPQGACGVRLAGSKTGNSFLKTG